MQAFVYVLGAATAKGPLTYVGWTHDVAQRLARHNAGKGARFTRGRVWKLLHCEPCASRRHAMSREWHLKRDRALRKKLAAGLVAETAASQALSACAPDAARFMLEATVS
jgi:Predicted endonuclease containing a URI domain